MYLPKIHGMLPTISIWAVIYARFDFDVSNDVIICWSVAVLSHTHTHTHTLIHLHTYCTLYISYIHTYAYASFIHTDAQH